MRQVQVRPPPTSGTGTDLIAAGRRRWLVGAALAVPAVLAFGWYVHGVVEGELKTVVREGLQSFLAHKVETLEEWIEQELKVARLVAADPTIHTAIKKTVAAGNRLGTDRARLLGDPAQRELSQLLRARMDAWGYPGAAVIAPNGIVLTALNKDYVGSRFFDEATPILKRVFQGEAVLAGPMPTPDPITPGTVEGQSGQAIMFSAVPVHAEDREVIAMFGFRIPVAKDFTRILLRGQMGNTGETYAFDSDGLLLSGSRFEDQLRNIGLLPRHDGKSMLRIKLLDPGVDLTAGKTSPLTPDKRQLTEMAASAIGGNSGVNMDGYRDYRGVQVVGAWAWIKNRGFGVASEVDYEEAYRPLLVLEGLFDFVLVLLALAIGGLLFYSRFNWVLRGRIRQTTRQLKKLGQYTLEEMLGEGGMGQVFRARHALLRRPTALKLLKPERNRAVDTMRFEREVQLTSMLTHPNTIAVYDYGRTPDGIFYYVMEYLNGLSLRNVVDKTGPLPPARVIHLLQQVCGSLAEAHRDGLVHRDIKPANIMVCERGGVFDVVKVLDFGLVRDLHKREGATLTQPDAVAGTPQYLSPEALRSSDDVDARSDLYSLGCVAYFLLTGRDVVQRDGGIGWVDQILNDMPAPPSSVIAGVIPEDIEKIVMACLQKSPDDRPQSAEEVGEALASCALAGDWTVVHARHWWELHGPEDLTGPGARGTSNDSTLLAKPRSLAIEIAGRGETA